MSLTVAVLAYDRLSPFHLSVPGVVFGELGAAGAEEWVIRVCATTPGALMTSDGYRVTIDHDLETLAAADLVIVPSWPHPDLAPPPDVCEAVASAHDRGALVAGLCLGAFVLAAAGLLDGRHATTHWRAATTLAERYPTVTVDPRVLFIDDGDVVTSAGTAASIDACLHIVRARLGSAVANQVAKGLVAAPYRDGGQAQYIDTPVPVTTGGGPLAATVTWALSNLGDNLSLPVLAGHAHMSIRNFERAFLRSYGTTPMAWVRRQRLRLAQEMLETTCESVAAVAAACGFGSAVTLRQNFVSEFGVSPARYRVAFQHRRTGIQSDLPPT